MSSDNNGFHTYAPHGRAVPTHPPPTNGAAAPYYPHNMAGGALRPALVHQYPNYPECNAVYNMSYGIRIFTGIDLVFAVINGFFFWPYIFFAFLIYFGFEGARKYRPNYLIFYMIYLCLMIILRCVLAGLYPTASNIIFGVLSVAINIYIFRLTRRLYKSLKNLALDKIELLRAGYQPNRREIILF